MSTVKTNNVQIGQSVTATNNFTWYQPAAPDGTVRLGNGNSGSATDRVTVTSAGNVGIGTTSPSYPLDVSGSNIRLSYNTSGGPVVLLNNTQGTSFKSQITWQAGGAAKYSIGIDYAGAGTNSFYWYDELSSSTRMLLDSSGNLGIGTSSPGARLGVTSPAATAAVTAFRSGSTDSVYLTLGRNAYEAGVGVTGSTVLLTGATSGDLNIYTNLAGAAIRFGTGNAGTIQATLDSSGNLGLGVTPSGWGAGFKAFDLGSYGTFLGNNSGQVDIWFNGYYNGTSSLYKNNNYASIFRQEAGVFKWFTAPSGTAGNAISFTQAMTLDASGNLTIRTTGALNENLTIFGPFGVNTKSALINLYSNEADYAKPRAQLAVCGSAYDNPYQGFQPNHLVLYSAYSDLVLNADTGNVIKFYCNTERARIDANGNLLVGTTTTLGKVTISSSGNSTHLYLTGAQQNAMQFTTATGTAGFIVGRSLNINDAQDFFIYDAQAGANRVAISSLGYLTVLGVYSNAAAATNAVNVNSSGVVYRSTSSRKYKEDIQDATFGLSDALKLRPITYVSKNKEISGDRRFGGLIAEEVDEAGLGVFVEYADDGSPDNVHYGNMVSLAFKAIQELSAELNELKKRIN